MRTRTFRDNNGVEWDVWCAPDPGGAKPTSPCLIFDSGIAHRRLAPAPVGWESAPLGRLAQMCRIAEPIDADELPTTAVGLEEDPSTVDTCARDAASVQPSYLSYGPRGVTPRERMARQSYGRLTRMPANEVSIQLPIAGPPVGMVATGGLLEPSDGPLETILLVEDSPDVQTVVRRWLERVGFFVVVAEDGRAALELLDHGPPVGLVLTDLVMPRCSGQKLIEELRARRNRPRLLAMTGYADEVRSGAGLPANVPVIEKPFTAEQLVRRVRDLLKAPAA